VVLFKIKVNYARIRRVGDRDRSVGIATRYGPRVRGSNPVKERNSLMEPSGLVLRSTQPDVQWKSETFPKEGSWGVALTTHPK